MRVFGFFQHPVHHIFQKVEHFAFPDFVSVEIFLLLKLGIAFVWKENVCLCQL